MQKTRRIAVLAALVAAASGAALWSLLLEACSRGSTGESRAPEPSSGASVRTSSGSSASDASAAALPADGAALDVQSAEVGRDGAQVDANDARAPDSASKAAPRRRPRDPDAVPPADTTFHRHPAE